MEIHWQTWTNSGIWSVRKSGNPVTVTQCFERSAEF